MDDRIVSINGVKFSSNEIRNKFPDTVLDILVNGDFQSRYKTEIIFDIPSDGDEIISTRVMNIIRLRLDSNVYLNPYIVTNDDNRFRNPQEMKDVLDFLCIRYQDEEHLINWESEDADSEDYEEMVELWDDFTISQKESDTEDYDIMIKNLF